MAPLHRASAANAKELGTKVKKGTWVVLWWAKWCPHCVTFHPIWNDAVKDAKKSDTSILEVEYELIAHMPKTMSNVRGFPMVTMYRDGKVIKVHEGDRTHQSIKDFIESAPAPKKKKVVNKQKNATV